MSIKTVISMVDWVEDNIASNPTLIEMSEHVGYSEFYCSVKYGFSSHEAFSRAFRKEFGCSPCEYRMHKPNIILYPKAEFDFQQYERSNSDESQYRTK